MPRGVILHGPPGTGKTLLAKAVAGESGVPVLRALRAPTSWTPTSASAPRACATSSRTARKSETGAIIFFDEIDAIGRARGGGASGADSEREGTLNQLLVELDGFGARDRVVVIAATNRLDMLDPALLRPGRFDRRVQVGLPAETGRLAILEPALQGHADRRPRRRSRRSRGVTAGFAGADLSNMVNEAAIMAARDGRETILRRRPRRGHAARRGRAPEGRPRASPRASSRSSPGTRPGTPWPPSSARPTRRPSGSRSSPAATPAASRSTAARTAPSPRSSTCTSAWSWPWPGAPPSRSASASSRPAPPTTSSRSTRWPARPSSGWASRPASGRSSPARGPHQIPLSGETRRVIDEEIGRMVDAAYADAVALLTDHRDELDALGTAPPRARAGRPRGDRGHPLGRHRRRPAASRPRRRPARRRASRSPSRPSSRSPCRERGGRRARAGRRAPPAGPCPMPARPAHPHRRRGAPPRRSTRSPSPACGAAPPPRRRKGPGIA